MCCIACAPHEENTLISSKSKLTFTITSVTRCSGVEMKSHLPATQLLTYLLCTRVHLTILLTNTSNYLELKSQIQRLLPDHSPCETYCNSLTSLCTSSERGTNLFAFWLYPVVLLYKNFLFA